MPHREETVFAAAMILSVLGFLGGAALVVTGERWPLGSDRARHAVRPWMYAALAIVVALGVTPHFYEELGIAGPSLVGLGFAAHWLAERRVRAPARFAGALLVPVLATHAAFDGAAIALLARAGGGVAPALLSFPVALHRVPEGILLAGVLLPRAGARLTIAVACAIGAVTLGGAFVGGAVLDTLGRPLLQSIVAGGVGFLLGVLARRSTHVHA
jgi:hypothetical protein